METKPILKEDAFLPLEMGKLEIEPVKSSTAGNEDNPFIISHWKSSVFTRNISKSPKCICSSSSQKKELTIPIYKKKNSRILREPTLKLLKSYTQNTLNQSNNNLCDTSKPSSRQSVLCHPENGLCSLVDNCNQLKISNDICGKNSPNDLMKECKWWSKRSKVENSRGPNSERNHHGPSCSQQALNPPCDVTIDELASYFETFVHIPKKMSSMAEMMYI